MRPRMLDLFCCQGGAAMGYYRAGWDIVGVDRVPQPRYPFEFHQADALEYLREHGHEFDAIHASPPCRDHTRLSGLHGKDGTGALLAQTRAALSVAPTWVIENVPGAAMVDPIVLCGSMFNLGVRRHRLFESNATLAQPACRHQVQGRIVTVTGHSGGSSRRDGSSRFGHAAAWREAMGIGWMTVHGLSQAIPPAYTEFIGAQLHSVVSERVAS